MLDKEELWCMKKTLELLNKSKQQILDIWEKDGGFDLAMFDVDIDLYVKINDNQIRVGDYWKKINSAETTRDKEP